MLVRTQSRDSIKKIKLNQLKTWHYTFAKIATPLQAKSMTYAMSTRSNCRRWVKMRPSGLGSEIDVRLSRKRSHRRVDQSFPSVTSALGYNWSARREMAEHVIVWDLETVPDLDAVARAHYLPEPAVRLLGKSWARNFPSCHFTRSSALERWSPKR